MNYFREYLLLKTYAQNDIENHSLLKKAIRKEKTRGLSLDSAIVGSMAGKIFRNRETFMEENDYCFDRPGFQLRMK